MSLSIVAGAVAALNDIVAVDGARIRLVGVTETAIELDLDLSESSCPECVVPKQLLVEIVAARLAEPAPDITTITINDPRSDTPGTH